MDIAENYSYQPKTIVPVVNLGYRAISKVFTNMDIGIIVQKI
jgi:hypothetical protein